MKIRALIFSLFCIILGCETPESPEKIPEVIPDVPLELAGVTWAHINANDSANILIDSIIVSYDEILGYDSALHTYLIAPIAGERIRSILYPTSGSRFVIAVDSIVIYSALFFPAYSSGIAFDEICVEPFSGSNRYRFELGYPAPDLYWEDDPRNDSRIISRFEEDNKLMVLED